MTLEPGDGARGRRRVPARAAQAKNYGVVLVCRRVARLRVGSPQPHFAYPFILPFDPPLVPPSLVPGPFSFQYSLLSLFCTKSAAGPACRWAESLSVSSGGPLMLEARLWLSTIVRGKMVEPWWRSLAPVVCCLLFCSFVCFVSAGPAR